MMHHPMGWKRSAGIVVLIVVIIIVAAVICLAIIMKVKFQRNIFREVIDKIKKKLPSKASNNNDTDGIT